MYIILANAAINEVLLTDDIDWESEDTVVSGLTSLAICGIEDPVRPEVRQCPTVYLSRVLPFNCL